MILNDDAFKLPVCKDSSPEGLAIFIAGVMLDVVRKAHYQYCDAHKQGNGEGYREGIAFCEDDIKNMSIISPELSKDRVVITARMISRIWSMIGCANIEYLNNEFVKKTMNILKQDLDTLNDRI